MSRSGPYAFARAVVTALLLLLALPASSWCQADVSTATVTGTLIDQTGDRMPAASVVLVSIERGTVRNATTDNAGVYRLSLVDPGTYDLQFAAPGFATRTMRIQLNVGQVAVVDAQLQVAGVVEQVVVTGAEQLIDVRRTQQANIVASRQVEYLPNVRRDFTPYVLILPGVSDPEAARAQNPGMAWPSTGFAVGGGNGHANLLTLDGGEHEYGTGVYRTPLNVETIREFQVNRNAFAAEFGFTSGSAVNIVTKSGTNRVSGDAYSYYRSDGLAARGYFDPPESSAYFQTVTVGATLGGPLVRNRLFGFGAYEGWRADRTRSKPYLDNVEIYGPTSTPSASIGLRSQEAYLARLAASSDPNVRRIVANLRQALTTTNYPATMALLRQNSGDITAKDRRHYTMGRVDYESDRGDTITGRFTSFRSTTDGSFTVDAPLQAPSNGIVIRAPDYALLGTWSRVLNSASVNQMRVQFAHNDSVVDPVSPQGTSINIDGVATFGRYATAPFAIRQKRYQLEDVFSSYRSGHTWKIGASYRPIDYNVRHELWFSGDWTFASGIYPILLAVPPADQSTLALANVTTIDPLTGTSYAATGPAAAALTGLQAFNLGLPFLYRQGVHNPEWSGWAHYLGSFAQDSWEVSRRFTLDYGMRFDVDAEPAPLQRHAYVSPRGGAAWDLSGTKHTVIRAGAGVFYAPIGVQVPYFGALLDDSGRYINQIFKTPLDGAQSPAALWGAGSALGRLPGGALSEADLRTLGVATGARAPGRVIFEVDPAYENPYTIQASVGISHQIANDMGIEVAYLSSRGHHLGLSREMNYRETGVVDALLGPTYTAIDPTIVERNVAAAIGSSVYHGMTVSLTRTYSRNYQFQVNYTLSRLEDDVTDVDFGLSAFMPTRLDREWGRSVFDVRHNLVAHAVLQTPAWDGRGTVLRALARLSVAPVFRVRSGGPFTLRIGRDINGDTHSNYDRPFQAERNTGRGPAFAQLDLRLSREFSSGLEPARWEVLVEATNLTNRTNFIAVNDVVGTDPQYLNPPFDRKGVKGASRFTPLAFNAAAPGRQVQVGVKLRF